MWAAARLVGGGMRMVESLRLRGRLLVERVASKAVKEDADQLATRVPSPLNICTQASNSSNRNCLLSPKKINSWNSCTNQ
jgi:hypothetical protein